MSNRTTSKIGYKFGNQSAGETARSSRGSLEIFGGGRAHAQTAALPNKRQQQAPRPQSPKQQAPRAQSPRAWRQQDAPFRSVPGELGVIGTAYSTHVGSGLGSESGPHRAAPDGAAMAVASSAAKQREQLNRWLDDVQSPYPARDSKRVDHRPRSSPETSQAVDGGLEIDLMERLRLSESRAWDELKLGELLLGKASRDAAASATAASLVDDLDLDLVTRSLRVADASHLPGEVEDASHYCQGVVAALSALSDTPSEWEKVLEVAKPGAIKAGGSGRPPSGSRQSRKSGVSIIAASEFSAEWEEVLQTVKAEGEARADEGVSNPGEQAPSSSHRRSRTSDTAIEVAPEWELFLRGGPQGGAIVPGTIGLPSRRSKAASAASEAAHHEWDRALAPSASSAASEASHNEWDRVLAPSASAGGSARQSRQSRQGSSGRQSNVSAGSDESSVVSERAAQWGYEVKLKSGSEDLERLTGSRGFSPSHGEQPQDGTKPSSSESSRAIPEMLNSIKDALSSIQLAFVVCDATVPEHPVLYASAGFFSMTGYSASEVVGRNCRFLQGPYTDPGDIARIRESLCEGNIFTGKLLNYKKDETPFWNLLTISPIKDDNGKLIKWIGMLAEVAESDSSQEEKLKKEVQARIKEEAQRQLKEASLNSKGMQQSGGGLSSPRPANGTPSRILDSLPESFAPSPPQMSKKSSDGNATQSSASTQTSTSTQTPVSLDRRKSKSGNYDQRRTSYSLTNPSPRYSMASSQFSSEAPVAEPVLPAPSPSANKVSEIAAARQEAMASNANKDSAFFHYTETPSIARSKPLSYRFAGRLFRKLKGMSSFASGSSSKSRPSPSNKKEVPFEFSESDGEDQHPQTTNPRDDAELAKQDPRSSNQSRNSVEDDETPARGRRSSANSYYTATSEQGGQEGRRSSDDLQMMGNAYSRPTSMGGGSGNKSMGQFCIVHS
uniref:Putative LOV domain-containing protein n=1 Tax=Pellia neesiana TaxID=70144 RepID=A0A126WYG8_PELNE|nr:putative LOV domain-containing protein [Pellia neesiana]